MTPLILLIGTGIALLLLLTVLAWALMRIGEALRSITRNLGNIAMGVRAIEKETAPLLRYVTGLNRSFEGLAGGFDSVESTLRKIAS